MDFGLAHYGETHSAIGWLYAMVTALRPRRGRHLCGAGRSRALGGVGIATQADHGAGFGWYRWWYTQCRSVRRVSAGALSLESTHHRRDDRGDRSLQEGRRTRLDVRAGWSGLADAYVLSIPAECNVPGINPDSILTLAEASARRALALAPKLGETSSSLGEILEYRDRADDALRAYEQGIALSPKCATGHQWYSYHLGNRNRWSEAIAKMEIAHRLDPLSHVITLSLAIAYDGADRFAEATPLYDQVLAQSPEAWYAWTTFVGHELALGKIDAAIDAMRTSSGSRADTAPLMRAARGRCSLFSARVFARVRRFGPWRRVRDTRGSIVWRCVGDGRVYNTAYTMTSNVALRAA